MKILIMKFSKCIRFFGNNLHKFKLEAQLKTLNHIVDEKQVQIKDAITII